MKFYELVETLRNSNFNTRVIVTSDNYFTVGGSIIKKGQFIAFSVDEEDKVKELGEKEVLNITNGVFGIIHVTL